MAETFSIERIERSYDEHPIRMENLLARIDSGKLRKGRIKESDLAFDSKGGLTDQNHVGGAAFVIEIGKKMAITRRTRVLELGSGTGGAARLLAEKFQCHVTGLEISAKRIADSKKLSALCGLTAKTRFVRANFCESPPKELKTYDLIISQNSLIHAPQPGALLKNWVPLLKHEGRIVIEDAFLRRKPAGDERAKLRRLLRIWNSHLTSLSGWDLAMLDSGCGFRTIEILSPAMETHFNSLRNYSARHGANASEHESYLLALELIGAGIIGYFRGITVPFSAR